MSEESRLSWRQGQLTHKDRFWDPPSLLFKGYWGSKQPGHEGDQCPPRIAKVRMSGVIPYPSKGRTSLWHIDGYSLCGKTGHGPHSTTLVGICVVRVLLFVLFGCYLCCSIYCLCVNVYCHRVTTQLQLINTSYFISKTHTNFMRLRCDSFVHFDLSEL
jgi:hypothetical protein